MTDPSQSVTIVGAGITGLACAYRLGQLGISATVLERSHHPGGVIDSEETQGFLFESGPQSFLGAEPLLTLVRELDLKKPPSIAESIDWARALLLLGVEEIDSETFLETMSVIIKHRTDMDVVAERVGLKLGSPADVV